MKFNNHIWIFMQNLTMMSPEAYQAHGIPINLSISDLGFLKSAILKSTRNRSRICVHEDSNEKLHEMFVIYGKETYVRPNRHFGKDESIFVLEGACDVYFFDLDGLITEMVELDASDPKAAYFCRIPKEIYHTVVIKSSHEYYLKQQVDHLTLSILTMQIGLPKRGIFLELRNFTRIY